MPINNALRCQNIKYNDVNYIANTINKVVCNKGDKKNYFKDKDYKTIYRGISVSPEVISHFEKFQNQHIKLTGITSCSELFSVAEHFAHTNLNEGSQSERVVLQIVL